MKYILATLVLSSLVATAATETPTNANDAQLAEYFRTETARLEAACLAEIKTLEDWNQRRSQYRQELFDMLGLWPLPARQDLEPVVTGKVEHEAITVEKLHFQSLPGLYVTANLYLPKGLTNRAPTILYVCGHGPVVSNGISYGNKVSYQHHGAWFARNGYLCLTLDTLQLGEIQGIHHGTYREKMWWWNARGYTPAGVEAWNCIRALDYLETRPEVDTNRFGVTGRSGGGAYSWWIAALDDRIKVAAPVAGITDLRNHVVDGTVEGHCDCMFFVNTYRWDYPLVAALVAPRPLLVVNTDSDTIFPLDGVYRTFEKVRRIYELHQARDKIGLVIGPGPHKDTQDLQLPVFRWFNRHLKGEDPVIEMAATKLFTPEQLRVFERLPAGAVNTNIQATFVPAAAAPSAPQSPSEWELPRENWRSSLKEKTFRGWPEEPPALQLEKRLLATRHGMRLLAYDYNSQQQVRLRLYLLEKADDSRPQRVVLTALSERAPGSAPEAGCAFEPWLAAMRIGFAKELAQEFAGATNSAQPMELVQLENQFLAFQNQVLTNKAALAFAAPRGLGPHQWTGNERKQAQLRRRFMLLGQTLDGMRVWDIRRAIQATRATRVGRSAALWLRAEGAIAADVLYAGLFEPEIARLDLWRLPNTHSQGPDLLNVLRTLDLPQAAALAAENTHIHLHGAEAKDWAFPAAVSRVMGWDNKRGFSLD